MPIYEYDCQDVCSDPGCPCPVDRLCKYKDADKPMECPKCERPLRRKVSASSFILQGGGWAKDGYSG